MQEDNKIQDTVNTESNENNETKTSYAVRPQHRQRRLIDYDFPRQCGGESQC